MSQTRFRPVYGAEETIVNLAYQEGYLYFATDSGKIFLDADGKNKKLMSSVGSGAGVVLHYGNDSDPQQIQDPTDDTLYTLDLHLIEGYETLADEDLILNTDGCFYKVISIDADAGTVKTTQLAVSGSGGGGTSVNDLRLKWDIKTINIGSVYIYGAKSYASFTPESDTDSKVNMTFMVSDSNGDEYDSFTVLWDSGKKYLYDTSRLPLGKNLSLKITVQASNSQMPNQSRSYTISSLSTIEMGIKKVDTGYLPLVPADSASGQLEIKYTPIGDADSKIVEYLHVYIDGSEDISYNKVIPTANYGRSVPLTIKRQQHGSHTIELAISAQTNGEDIYTEKVQYEGAWATAGNETPIIWIGNYDSLVVNYENSYIQFMVYDPVAYAANIPATIQIYKDAKVISEMSMTFTNSEWYILDISAMYEVGTNIFSIACRSEKKDVTVEVTTEGSRDLGLINEESLVLSYTSAGRSNMEIKSSKEAWNAIKVASDYDKSYSSAILSGFNWQNNGWRNDGKGADGIDNGAYLAIANGASVSIPVPSLTLNQRKDYSIECRFRIRNVQKYSTLIQTLPTYFYSIGAPGSDSWVKSDKGALAAEIERNGWYYWKDEYGNKVTDDENPQKIHQTTDGVICKWMNSNEMGLCLGSQEAYFRTSAGIVNVRYKEDEVINITFVVSVHDNMLYIYLNGILSGANKLPNQASGYFQIDSPFVFNSDYCDVDLYRFRIYETSLEMPDVIHNYLSDIHSIALYDQNQLTNSLTPTQLSYELLVDYNKKNPDALSMPYATWKILDGGREEKLPYYKGDKCSLQINFVNPCLDRALETGEIDEWYYYTHSPSFTATGAQIDVQGTSSQGYPRRNYKIKYKKAKDTWVYTKGSLAGKPMTATHTVTDKNGVEHTLAKKFHMDNEDVGTNAFTWKIDYMESSGSYNTGFANLLGNKMYPLYTKHPLEDLNAGIDTDNLRTTVYGFPVLVFHEYADSANNVSNNENSNYNYEYIGRYNMNLDKGSNEYYGFEEKTPHPYVTKEDGTHPTIAEVAECWELSDNQGTWCSFRYPNQEAREKGFGTTQTGYTDRLEMIQHFEYRYSYYKDQIDAIGSDGKYDGSTDDPNIIAEIGTTNAEKSAYLRKRYANLERVFNWLDSTDTQAATNAAFAEPITLPTVKDYTSAYIYTAVQAGEEYSEANTYYVVSEDDPAEYTKFKKTSSAESDSQLVERFNFYRTEGRIFTREIDPSAEVKSILTDNGVYNTTFVKDTADYRIEKFRNEFDLHFDREYCFVYFIMTELLLCYDSRGKNLMLASFGPKKADGDYIWYPIFYDIDTQLGINNSGAALWDYDADVSKDHIFSTATSVLWNNLFSAFEDEIKDKYRVLRGSDDKSKVVGKLTYDAISGAYSCDPEIFDSYAMKGIRPIIAIGLDEYYKYFATTTHVGYFDTSGKKIIESTPSYAYACQGDKKLTIELLLRNRLNYIDSWWQGGAYFYATVKMGQLTTRVNGNNKETSDKYLDKEELTPEEIAAGYKKATYPLEYYDARPGYKLKPFLKQYVTYFIDEIPSTPVKYIDSEEQADGVWTAADDNITEGYKSRMGTPAQQLNYIPGVDYLSSLGDLSVSYIDQFKLDAGKRLLDLRIGSDAPGYVNNLISSNNTFELSAEADSSTKKPLLKQVILTNIPKLDKTIDVSGSEKLQEFRALNTIISQAIFANGAPLHTVHLPKSIMTLNLNENQDLKNIITSYPVVMSKEDDGTIITHDPETYRGLYLEGITDYQETTGKGTGHRLDTLIINGGGLGYGSYTIFRNLYDIKKTATENKLLRASLTDVNWTPYVLVENGERPQANFTYYLLTDHSTYIPYVVDTDSSAAIEEFNSRTLNELVYTLDESVDKSVITSLEFLDKLIEQYEVAKIKGEASQFSNTNGSSFATVPTITGNMFVANADGEAIVEDELTSKYKAAFPSLTITAENIREAYITKYVKILDNGKEETVEILRTNDSHPLAPTGQVPTKTNYDFKGWTLDPSTNEIFINYDYVNQTYTNMDEALNSYTFSTSGEILTLYAVFEIHKWVITFKDDTGLISYPDATMLVPAGTIIGMPAYVPTKQDDSLAIDETYVFEGWTQSPGSTTILNMDQQRANKDQTFYAYYGDSPVSVYENIVDDKYLIFNALPDGSGYSIQANPAFSLSGKVTLPLYHNGQPIVEIATQGFAKDYTKTNNITHIFWENRGIGGKMTTIGVQAFGLLKMDDENYYTAESTLVHFEFPSGLKYIKDKAFSSQYYLEIQAFPLGIEEIGEYAFKDCYDLNTSIIHGVTIKRHAFSGAFGKQATVVIGDDVVTIDNNAFAYYRGINHIGYGKWTTVNIGSGIQSIAANAFSPVNDEDGYNTIKTITINRSDRPADLVANQPFGASRATVDWV